MYKFQNVYLLLLIFLLATLGCNSKDDKSSTTNAEPSEATYNNYESGGSHDDGEFCATVEYYNSVTGTSSTYTLTVHVEDGKLIQIDWSNGGWLDDTHFDPPNIDDDGACSFTTYDGKDYDIQIDEEGGCTSGFSSPEEDDDYYEQRKSKRLEQEEEQRIQEEEEEEARRQEEEQEEMQEENF